MQYWGLTDPGCVRPQNQDTYIMERLDRNTVLCVVCDGMGGAKSGNIASSLAMDVFVDEIKRSWTPTMDQEKMDQMMLSAAKLANFTVYDQSAQFEEFSGMGTTLVAVVIDRENAVAVHVGDSRLYRLEVNTLEQITTDHSVVQEMIDRGQLTEEQARSHPRKHFITRAIGVEGTVRCEFDTFTVSPDTRLLLCTDGLTNMLSDEKIEGLLRDGSPETVPGALVDAANAAGGEDNITAVIFA